MENSLSNPSFSPDGAGGCCGASLLQKAAATSATVILSRTDTTAQRLLGCCYEESFIFCPWTIALPVSSIEPCLKAQGGWAELCDSCNCRMSVAGAEKEGGFPVASCDLWCAMKEDHNTSSCLALSQPSAGCTWQVTGRTADEFTTATLCRFPH